MLAKSECGTKAVWMLLGFLYENCLEEPVAPGFKDKAGYTPYMSLENQITYMATNRGNIKVLNI